VESLKGKKVFFIGLDFYDYDSAIKEKLENFGSIVDYYIDKPEYLRKGIFSKVLNLLKVDQASMLEKYYKTILDDAESVNYDFVFVIKGEFLSEDFIIRLRKQQKNATFIMYQWDSLIRVPNAFKLMPYFDKVYSFDRIDCKKYKKLEFKPLFFRKKTNNNKQYKLKFDLVFFGSVHSDRLKIIKKVQKYVSSKNLHTKIYLLVGIRSYIKCLLKNESKNMHIRALDYEKLNTYVLGAKTILDLPDPMQNGLTMRTIEALGANKKLITTNKDIINYDFYHKENIYIIDQNDINIDIKFFDKPYKSISHGVRDKYSLECWIKDMFVKNK